MSTEKESRKRNDKDVFKPLDSTRPIAGGQSKSEEAVQAKPKDGTLEPQDSTRPIADPKK